MLSALFLLAVLSCVNADSYCPSSNDLVVAYGNPSIFNQGWTNSGGEGVATKSAFNLLGGSVEYDIDFSKTGLGVNGNIYTISPSFSGSSYSHSADYCDGQKSGSQWCTEVDWIETNGNCGGASTLHTRAGPGSDGCTAWGCQSSYNYNGNAIFHMKITYGTDGTWTTERDGQVIASLNPSPQSQDWSTLQQQYQSRGAVLISTLWSGWVPSISGCGTSGGDLSSSSFTVSNLVITGTVVQGPIPNLCSGSNPSNPPPSNPPPSNPPPSNPPPSNPPSNGGCQVQYVAGTETNNWWLQLEIPNPSGSIIVTCASGSTVQLSSASWGGNQYVGNPSSECDSPRRVNIGGNDCDISSAGSFAVTDPSQQSSTTTTASDSASSNPYLYALIGCGVAILVLLVVVIVLGVKISRRGTEQV